jgi:hypothetical protein
MLELAVASTTLITLVLVVVFLRHQVGGKRGPIGPAGPAGPSGASTLVCPACREQLRLEISKVHNAHRE